MFPCQFQSQIWSVFLCPADAKCNLSKSNYLWSLQTHVSPFPLSLVASTYIYHKYFRGWILEVNICPIWNVSSPSSSQRAVDRAPNHFVWDVRFYHGCFLFSWPNMNMAALNMYSHRISLFLQMSRTPERMKETNLSVRLRSGSVTCHKNQILSLTSTHNLDCIDFVSSSKSIHLNLAFGPSGSANNNLVAWSDSLRQCTVLTTLE